MKHHRFTVYPALQRTEPGRRHWIRRAVQPDREAWINHHARLTAFMLAVFITVLILALLSTIHFYMMTGIWPLFG